MSARRDPPGGLVWGPHPDHPGRCLVWDPNTDQRFELARADWEELRADLSDGTAGGPAANGRRAAPQWRAGPTPRDAPLHVHPEARFRCEGSGLCCRMGYSVPLSAAEGRRARAAARAHGLEGPVVGYAPRGQGESWRRLLVTDPACRFLRGGAHCLLHGQAAQPGACEVFPLRFVLTGGVLRASLSHRCLCDAGGGAPLLSADLVELARRARRAPRTPRLPPHTRVDAHRRLRTPEAVGCLDRGALASRGPEARLHAAARALAAAGGPSAVRPPLAHGSGGALAARLLAALPGDGESERLLAAALSGGPHPDVTLIQALHPGPEPEAEGQLDTLVRDLLFGLEPYRAPSLALGLLAIGLAVGALRGCERRPLRAQVMLWEEVLQDGLLHRRLAAERALDDVQAVAEWLCSGL